MRGRVRLSPGGACEVAVRILIDLTHPAHLHFYRQAIASLRGEGHEVLLAGRRKDCLHQLAAEFGLQLESFGDFPSGWIGKAQMLAYRQWRLLRLVRRFRPDVLTAIGGTFIGLVGCLTRVPTVVFTDTESATLSNWLTFPFASRICVPRSYQRDRPRRLLRYDGCHELAYLRASQFQPDARILAELGVQPGERYAIVRFVDWQAGHDFGRRGLTRTQKTEAVKRLAKLGRVLVSSEAELPPSLEAYHFPLPARRMHDALAHAALLLGESSTMSLEAAVLGVPSVFIYPPVELGIVREHERRKIIHWHAPEDFDQAMDAAENILRTPRGDHWHGIARQFAADSIDVSEFIRSQVLVFAPPSEQSQSR